MFSGAYSIITMLFVSLILLVTFPADGGSIPLIFEDHSYTLHDFDGQGRYYYIDFEERKLHRYSPQTEKWEKQLFKFTSPSPIMTVHLTINNYIFVGLQNGTIYRSTDGGNSFSLNYEWQAGGYSREWSIASDEKWILIGEYGMKNNIRRVCATDDWGDTWNIVYETPEKEGAHIHRVAIDPYTKEWWITVGDYPIGRVLYSSDHGIHWNKVECPATGRRWQPWQPCNILFFEYDILLINEPLPQVFKVDRKTMTADYLADIGNFPSLAPPYSAIVGKYGIYASIVHYTKYTHDPGIFVSYDKGYTWERLINFTAWPESVDPFLKKSYVFGANHLVYKDGYIHATCMYGGRAFKFEDTYYVPEIQSFDIIWENISYIVTFHSSSIVTHFNFDQSYGKISFYVSGISGTDGYCNITLPKVLLKDPPRISIVIDDVPASNITQTENTDQISIHFIYMQANTHHIIISGLRYIDIIAPAIEGPNYLIFEEGESDQIIIWYPSDDHPLKYNISRNGVLVEADVWNGSVITLDVSLLSFGIYEYSCTVIDESGQSANNTVIVYVTPTTITEVEMVTETVIVTEIGGISRIMTISAFFGLFILLLMFLKYRK